MAPADEPELVACHGPHALDMSEKCFDRLARLYVPNLDGIVQAARYQHRFLRTGSPLCSK